MAEQLFIERSMIAELSHFSGLAMLWLMQYGRRDMMDAVTQVTRIVVRANIAYAADVPVSVIESRGF
jgi:hypothetical protein